ncbi:MAG: cytochrome c maturation protein CcmE [Dehalococcoidales bacterium]
MLRKRKFLIGGFIVFLTIAYLGYLGFQGSATYYYTVSELVQQGSSIYNEKVRVNGQVAPGSVEQEPESFALRFIITEGGQSLPVVYQGIVPDAFKVGNDVVVEGHLSSVGIFQANAILVKCPSKYVPKK